MERFASREKGFRVEEFMYVYTEEAISQNV